ncbi:MAG: amidinotransferase [Planctomycetales bacterium]|nr:amidinotransferase [Planctomycetales bacterium]
MSLSNIDTPAPRIMMCPPDHYGIEYEINAWMSTLRQADNALAVAQWGQLRDVLEHCGAEVLLQPPVKGLPDLVFTANAALIYHDRAVLSRFRHPQRQGEQLHDRQWLEEQGFRVEELPDGMHFEGAGDALFCGDTLLSGYRMRSDAAAMQEVGRRLNHRVIPLELADPYYYHLDTCLCPLAPGRAIYFPGAFDDYGRRVLQDVVKELIEVGEDEARSFACNAVVVGKHVVTNVGCPRLHQDLRSAGFTPHETPLSEFVKSGGSAKCLTLRLDGEEAASWKYAMV